MSDFMDGASWSNPKVKIHLYFLGFLQLYTTRDTVLGTSTTDVQKLGATESRLPIFLF